MEHRQKRVDMNLSNERRVAEVRSVGVRVVRLGDGEAG